jgi:hypothetical protein
MCVSCRLYRSSQRLSVDRFVTVLAALNILFDDIIKQAKSDSGHNPEGTVLVLISKDEGFIELIDELIKKGVHVYVISPHVFNNRLMEKVGQAYSIPWYPVSVEQPKRELKNTSSGLNWWLR